MERDPSENTEKNADAADERPGGLFRDEALRYHLGEAEDGDVLRMSPAWTRWAYWLLVAVVVVGMAFLILGRAPVYQAGPAIVMAEGKTPLTAWSSGTVHSIHAHPGQRVAAGDLLVEFRSEREQSDLARVEREFELKLIERLRSPSDDTSGRELQHLRAERQQLESRLEERRIRAPADGIVSDVRIRQGLHVEQGAPLLSLIPADPEYTVMLLLPGHARPQLEPGMNVRLELVGFPHVYVYPTVEEVAQQIVGPSEARRFLGPESADSVTLDGPVVLVRCRLDSATFHDWGREYSLHDGMLARAEVIVRDESVLMRLIPGLRLLRSRTRV